MKYTLLSYFLCLSYLLSAQTQIATDWEKDKLVGEVQSIMHKQYKVIDKEMQLDRNWQTTYNQTGGKLEEQLFVNDTSIIIQRCEYGDFQTKGNEWIYEDDGETIVFEITRMYFGDSLLKMQITKQPNGNSMEEIRHYQNNSLTQRTIAKSFNYEQASLDIENYENDIIVNKERISYYGLSESKLFSTYVYDDEQLISEKLMDNTKTLRIHNTYTYHKNGKVKAIIVKGLKKGKMVTQYEHTFQYNKKAKLIAETKTTYSSPTTATKIENTFDKYGNITSIISYSEAGRINEATYFDYDYDKKGNWLEKRTLRGEQKQLVEKIERVIQYY